MTDDPYSEHARSISSFGRRGRMVTPNDDADLEAVCKALVVCVGGDVSFIPVDNVDDEPVSFSDVPAGAILPYLVRRVMATGTTATLATVED